MANISLPPRPEHDVNLGPNMRESNNSDKGMTGDVLHTSEEIDALFSDDKDPSQRTLDYDTFQQGFSDDEDGEDAFNRSWTAQQVRKKSQKSKKSPRRSENSDGGDETSPRTKRPRKSLFGGPAQELLSPELKKFTGDHMEDEEAHNASTPDIRHRICSLDLNQQDSQDEEDVQQARDEHTSDLGPDLGTSAVASPLPAWPRAPSEESIDIPPDTEVSMFIDLVHVAYSHNFRLYTSCARTSTARKHSPISTPTRRATTTQPRKQT
jgi:hypothetical protein